MAYLKEKQRTLKLFFKHELKNRYNPFDYDPTDIVKMCLTAEQIQNALEYDYELISSICHTLKSDGNITIFHDDQLDPHGIETYYLITPEGKKAHFEKYYLNQSKFQFHEGLIDHRGI